MGAIKDVKKEKHFFEGKAFFNLFGVDIGVLIDLGSADFDYAEKCVAALNNMSEETIDKLCEYSILYCEIFCDKAGEAPPQIVSKRDILRHIHPGSLHVNIPEDGSIVISLQMACDWEVEHGLEWLIKDDKILYVGDCCGETPYESEAYYHTSWNYANLKKDEKNNAPTKQFDVEGHCPEQNKIYTITVHAVPNNGAWKIFAMSCDHKLKNKQKCAQMICPIIPNQIDEPVP